MESMRVKPAGTGNLDKLESVCDSWRLGTPQPSPRQTLRRRRMTKTPDRTITRIVALPPEVEMLEALAASEGFDFMTRLLAEWRSGTNRFDQPGECLFAAFEGGRMVGMGGLTIDPYLPAGDVGRLRRLYVVPSVRRRGIGAALVDALLQHASGRFRLVRLRTDTQAGADFYLRCGFSQVDDDSATHAKPIADALAKTGECAG
jgi:GNAT superfamily N-acetyltransferase